jgi:hypothetical protein
MFASKEIWRSESLSIVDEFEMLLIYFIYCKLNKTAKKKMNRKIDTKLENFISF